MLYLTCMNFDLFCWLSISLRSLLVSNVWLEAAILELFTFHWTGGKWRMTADKHESNKGLISSQKIWKVILFGSIAQPQKKPTYFKFFR